MKIGIDISQIVYQRGVSRYTKELILNLLKIDSKNEYVLFGSSLRQQGKLREFTRELQNKKATSKLYPIPPTILEFLFNKIHLSIDPFIGRVDVFHSSDWTQPKSKAKKVTTIHDMIAHKFPNIFDQKTISVQKRRLRWVKKEVDKIIAVSENTKKDIVDILQIPREKITVIYEGASKDFYTRDYQEQEEARKKFCLSKDYILTVTTRSSQKLGKLLESFRKIRKVLDLSLVIVGDFDLKEEGIVPIGYVDDDDLARLYSGAKLFVFPSLYEGFGLPVLEAMACGCPIVCSKTSSLPEIGGDAVIYIDPESERSIREGVEKVLNLYPNEIFALAKRSRQQAQKFSWQKTAEETLKVYHEVLQF